MSRKIKAIARRKLILGGGTLASAAAFSIFTSTQANTQPSLAAKPEKTSSSGRFEGKVVLITGATSGIGEATARAFAKEGAIVHFCGRRENLGQKVAQEINATGGRASFSFLLLCTELAAALNVSICNVGIDLKAVVGGYAIRLGGLDSIGWIAGLLSLLALSLLYLAATVSQT